MITSPHLSFTVRCSACYGAEVWQFERITRTLVTAGILPSAFEPDIEAIAELFIAHSKQLYCPGCNKTGLITVHRIVS